MNTDQRNTDQRNTDQRNTDQRNTDQRNAGQVALQRKWHLPPFAVVVHLLLIFGLALLVAGTSLGVLYSDLLPYWLHVFLLFGTLLDGVVLIFFALRKLQSAQTTIPTFNKPLVLVSDGIFRYSRNPIYIGMTQILVSASLANDIVLTLILPISFFLLAALYYVPFEEKMMSETFGDSYVSYQQQTRRWI